MKTVKYGRDQTLIILFFGYNNNKIRGQIGGPFPISFYSFKWRCPLLAFRGKMHI